MTPEFIESREEMEQILHEEVFGFLGMSKKDVPYVVPLNYTYIDGRIIFHCSLEGEKLDHIRANPQVCFSVARQPGQFRRHAQGSNCEVNSESVVCFGTARFIDNLAERAQIINTFNRSFRPGDDDIPLKAVKGCGAVEITISEMTGRRERDQTLTCWRYRFDQK